MVGLEEVLQRVMEAAKWSLPSLSAALLATPSALSASHELASPFPQNTHSRSHKRLTEQAYRRQRFTQQHSKSYRFRDGLRFFAPSNDEVGFGFFEHG